MIYLSIYLSNYLPTYLSTNHVNSSLPSCLCVCSSSSAVGVPAILQRHSRLPGVSHLHVHHLWISWPCGHMAQVLSSLVCSAALWHVARTGKHWALKSAGPSEMNDGCEPELTANISVKFENINQQLEPPCCRILGSGWGNVFQMLSQTSMTLGTDKGQVSKTWRCVLNYLKVLATR